MNIKKITLTALLGVGLSLPIGIERSFAEQETFHVGKSTLNFSQTQIQTKKPYQVQPPKHENEENNSQYDIPRGAEVPSWDEYYKKQRDTGITIEKFKPRKVSRTEKVGRVVKMEIGAWKDTGRDLISGSFETGRGYLREGKRVSEAGYGFVWNAPDDLKNSVVDGYNGNGCRRKARGFVNGFIDLGNDIYEFGKEVAVTPVNVLSIPYDNFLREPIETFNENVFGRRKFFGDWMAE